MVGTVTVEESRGLGLPTHIVDINLFNSVTSFVFGDGSPMEKYISFFQP